MTAPLFTLIGMGDDGLDGLSPAARNFVATADIIVGSRRLLAHLGECEAEVHAWPSPFDPMAQQLRQWTGRSVVVLATGDPMWFGAGSTLLRHFSPGEFTVIAHTSAFQLACARLGWAMQDVATLSLHGRDLALLEPHILPGNHLIALTSGATSIVEITDRLVRRGFGNSRVHVLEHMGGANENHVSFTAQDVPSTRFSDFNTLAIECVMDKGITALPPCPGLLDDAFSHDGQLTKREVRAATLAALAPRPDALLWDVGAGCGSIAIEWMRAARNAGAVAFERHPDRIAMMERNRDSLGTPGLRIISGDLPGTLEDQPAPDAVFIGGGTADPDIVAAAWQALKPGGRMVANAVTLEGEAHLIDLHGRHGGELVRIGIEVLTNVGGRRALRPRMTVTQWRTDKP
jgi:precorrin-6Y C5,15-methyltransferase (decarboxylating)